MVHALAALVTLLRIVMGDAANEAVLGAVQAPAIADASCLLASICDGRGEGNIGKLPGEHAPVAAASDAPMPDRMRVERTTSWLHATATQLGRMLPPLFSVLRRHPRSSVRVAAAHAADEMLCHCWRTLPACSSACLECLLCLAHDQWPQVADAACSSLQQRASAVAADGISHAWLDALLVRQLTAFEAACTSEADATVAARLLAGAVGISGPARAVAAIASPSRRSQLCRRLATAFAMSSHAVQHHAATTYVSNEPMQLLVATSAVLGTGMLLPRRHARYSVLTCDEVRAV